MLRLLWRRQEAPGWQRLAALPPPDATDASPIAVLLPLQIIVWSLVACGLIFLALVAVDADHRVALLATGLVLLVAAGGVHLITTRTRRRLEARP